MTIPVYDYRTNIANVIVRPEIRARFMRMEPGPAKPDHSHDLGGEIFLVLEGQCEFVVEGERVTCGPGELIYIEPRVKHTLHAVGDVPCVVYLSVTPHVEPTHTRYDDDGAVSRPTYGGWRGNQPNPNADRAVDDLARAYQQSAQHLAELAQSMATALERHASDFAEQTNKDDQAAARQTMDTMWEDLRDLLWQVRDVESAWNDLSPRAMPTS